MTIPEVKRPWERKGYGTRLTVHTFHKTKLWRNTVRPTFLQGTTLWNGIEVPNTLCIECYKQGTMTPTYAVDHILAIEDGGSPTDHANLQGLCERHHNSKSAHEGNNRRKK